MVVTGDPMRMSETANVVKHCQTTIEGNQIGFSIVPCGWTLAQSCGLIDD